jgi:hypothetical protein
MEDVAVVEVYPRDEHFAFLFSESFHQCPLPISDQKGTKAKPEDLQNKVMYGYRDSIR